MPNYDPEMMQAFAEAMDRATSGTERLAAVMEKAFGKPLDDAKELETTYKQSTSRITRMIDSVAKRWDKFNDKVNKTWKKLKEDPTRGVSRGIKSLNSGIGKLAGLAGAGGMLGVGGLLGLIMYGKYTKAKYIAAGQEIAQQFKKVGATAEGAATLFGNRARHLSSKLGKDVTNELVDIAGKMAEFGVGGVEAMSGASFATDGVRRSLVETTFVLDKLFKTATLPAVGQVMIDTNASLSDSITIIKDIGLAAGQMGMSFHEASGAVTQSTSAMRIMGMDSRAVANTMARIQTGFKAMGMHGKRAGALAAQGIKAVGGALGGMDLGMLGFLGERVTARLAQQTGGRVRARTGVEAAVAMERGMVGGDANVFGTTMAEMLQYSKQSTSTNAEQYLLLKEMLGGNKEAANALMALQKDAGTKATTETIAEMATKQADRLKGILDEESKTMTFYSKLAHQLRLLIANLGDKILEVMMNGFSTLVLWVRHGINWLTTGGEFSEEYKAAFKERSEELGTRGTAAWKSLTDSTEKLGEKLGQVSEVFVGRTFAETFHTDLPDPRATPVPKSDFERRAEATGQKLWESWTSDEERVVVPPGAALEVTRKTTYKPVPSGTTDRTD